MIKYCLNYTKLKDLIEENQKGYKDYKNLFCYATRISEKELDNFLYGSHEIELKTLQKICQYSILTLDDFFERI